MRLSVRRTRLLVLGTLLTMALAACVPGTAASPGTTASDDGGPVTGEIVVLAAASLRVAFEDLGAAFEAQHPGARVTFSFGGSAGLAEQIVSGAPADVFAAASTATMDTATAGLRDAEVAGREPLRPALFATNSMALVVPLANEARVREITDLERGDVMFASCEEHVPCGAAARRVLDAAGIDAAPVTYEKDVTAVLTKVRSDEVDAGLVYVTDIDDTVQAVELPDDLTTTTAYPILALPQAPHPSGAAAFTAFVLSAQGRDVLARHGFAAP